MAQKLTRRQLQEIEDAWRQHAFHVFYHRVFADEPDSTMRFIRALVASAAPIRRRKLMIRWYYAHFPHGRAQNMRLCKVRSPYAR